MKNKGFTLIELLAVIVILAIIALIATPVVLNIIKDSKNNSTERSIELYLDQVKNEIARYNMVHPGANFNPTECVVESEGLKCDGTTDYIKIEINGITPNVGSKILLSNGKIIGISNFKVSDAAYSYNNGKIGQLKPFCKAVTTATSGNIPNGNYTYGDEYICDVGDGEDKTFFVLENNTDTVSLIMYANVGVDGKAVTSSSTNKSLVAWISKEDYIAAGGTENEYLGENGFGSNDKGPITVTKALKEYTSTWTNLSSSQIAMPTRDQIYKAAGNKNSPIPKWLYDYLKGTTHPVSEVEGYWTSTPSASSSNFAIYVRYYGYVDGTAVSNGSSYGIRPVITISKSMLD